MDLNSIERIEEYSALPAERYVGGRGLGDFFHLGLDEGDEEEEEEEEENAETEGRGRGGGSAGGGADSAVAMLQTESFRAAHPEWPKYGNVEFKNISLRYMSCVNPVLR
jgi:hypothetical protein